MDQVFLSTIWCLILEVHTFQYREIIRRVLQIFILKLPSMIKRECKEARCINLSKTVHVYENRTSLVLLRINVRYISIKRC